MKKSVKASRPWNVAKGCAGFYVSENLSLFRRKYHVGESTKHAKYLAALVVLGLASLVGCMGLQAPAKPQVPASNAKRLKSGKATKARLSETYGRFSISFETDQSRREEKVCMV